MLEIGALPRTARRAGFSLIELLVVITIIGILVGLLLPAVQAAREAARRLQCSNHLKQIGLAIHLHHEAQGMFPAGNFAQTAGICTGNQGPDAPSEDRANWMILILPYLEQGTLQDIYHLDTENEAAVNQGLRETSVDSYLCPSDLDPTTPVVPAWGPASPANRNIAYMPGSYRGVSGRSDGKKFLDSGQYTSYPRSWRGPLHVVGVLGFRPESLMEIRDGSSNTLMVGESTTRTNLGHRTLWAYSFKFYSLSAVTPPQSRTLLGDFNQCVLLNGYGYGEPCMRQWGSFHPGGSSFLLCDGSVRSLGTTIDMTLFANLATIDGGELALVP